MTVMETLNQLYMSILLFFFQAEDGIRDADVTGVQTCALPILPELRGRRRQRRLEGRYSGAAAPRLRPVRSAAHLSRDAVHLPSARGVPLPHAHAAACH